MPFAVTQEDFLVWTVHRVTTQECGTSVKAANIFLLNFIPKLQIQAENRSLQATVKELERKLTEAEKKGEEQSDEKDRRIEILQNELEKLQSNEGTLNDTIEELRDVENALRSQVNGTILDLQRVAPNFTIFLFIIL